MEPQNGGSSWHFEKRISLDTIVAILGVTVLVGLPIFVWARATDDRMTKMEARDEARTKQETARELDARDQRIAVLTQMDKLAEQVTQLRIDLGGVIAVARRAQATDAAHR